MKYTTKNTSDTQVLLSVTLDAADLASVQQKTLQQLAKKVKVAGFRPGKVPADVAKKNLDPNYVASEVLQDAVNQFVTQALDAEKIIPLDRPKVEVQTYVPEQQVAFTADIPILPAIKLGDYKKLSAKQDPINITAKEVDDVIERMRQGMAKKEDVKRAAKNGDEVLIDFAGTDQDGKDVPGAKGDDYPLTLGSNSFIPGFEEGLIGKKAGDKLELPLTFPKDYHHKPLAGAKVNFAVTVKAVKEVVAPALDDKFAAQAGPFTTVADLKADVKRELTTQKEREALDKLKDSLVEQLVKGSHIPTPDVLVDDQLESLERDFVQNLMYRGMTLDQYLQQQGVTKEDWRAKELRDQAIRRVQVGLALAELSKVEAIQASKDELEARLAEMLQQYGNAPEIIKQLDTPEARRDIANRVITEKTVNRLVELNKK